MYTSGTVPDCSNANFPVNRVPSPNSSALLKYWLGMNMAIVVDAQVWMPKNTAAESAEVCRWRRSQLPFAFRFQRSEVKPGALELINCVFRGSRPAAGMAYGEDSGNSFGERGTSVP